MGLVSVVLYYPGEGWCKIREAQSWLRSQPCNDRGWGNPQTLGISTVGGRGLWNSFTCLGVEEGQESWRERHWCSGGKQSVLNGTTHCLGNSTRGKADPRGPCVCFLGTGVQWKR